MTTRVKSHLRKVPGRKQRVRVKSYTRNRPAVVTVKAHTRKTRPPQRVRRHTRRRPR